MNDLAKNIAIEADYELMASSLDNLVMLLWRLEIAKAYITHKAIKVETAIAWVKRCQASKYEKSNRNN